MDVKKRNPANRRTREQALRDQEAVARLYLQGTSKQEIMDRLGITLGNLNFDLRRLRKRWKESALEAMDARVAVESARVKRIYAAAWEAYEKSKEQRVTVNQKTRENEETGERIKEASRRVEEQYGDPRFLEIALRCIERICKIYGVDGPIKIETNQENKVGVLMVPGMISPEEWAKTAREYADFLKHSKDKEAADNG